LNLVLTDSLIPPTSSETVIATAGMVTSGTPVQPSPSAMHGVAVLATAQSKAALSSQDALDSASVVVSQPASDADAWWFAPFGGRDADVN
jgi:hypothetical protein